MAKNLTKVLKTDMMADLDLAALAQILRSRGRGNDSILAHITPKEAALLKKRGGSGTINPATGLPEFDDGADVATTDQPAIQTSTETSQGASEAPSTPDVNVPAGGSQEISAPSFDLGSQPGYGAASQPGFQGPTAQQTAAFIQGEPGQLTPDQLGSSSTAQPDQAGKPGLVDKALSKLTDPGTLAKLGLTAGLGAYGAYQSNQAKNQAAQATQQKQAIAAPYQQQGQQMIAQAQAGQLSAPNQQIVQAQRARLQQASVNMGGVGQQQIESQISTLTNQLLNNQYQYGLQVLQIGDNIAIGAINSQLQIDNQLAAANKSFYSSLANLVAGSPSYVQGMTQVTPPKA